MPNKLISLYCDGEQVVLFTEKGLSQVDFYIVLRQPFFISHFSLFGIYGVPIRHKFVDSGRRQRMLDHLLKNLVGHCCNMGAKLCTLDNMHGVTDAGCDDLRLNFVDREDLCNIRDQL